MEHGEKAEDIEKIFAFNAQIIKILFDVPESVILQADVMEQLAAAKTIHFVMQDIVTPKFLELNPERPELIPEEKSAFDAYDEENGYNDLPENTKNVWQICRDNLDRIVKLCVKDFNASITECMQTEIISLLDHLKFELATIKEK